MKRLFWWTVALVTTAAIVITLANAGRVADGDTTHLMAVEIRLSQLLHDGQLGRAARAWWGLLAPHPPLGYLPGVLVFSVLGVQKLSGPLAMGLSLLLAWDALYRLWAGRAWLAWLAILGSPLVWADLDRHGRDFVGGAVLLQIIAWLVASAGFSKRRASLAFGLWLGVGFLTKYTVAAYMLLPCLLAGLGLVRPWSGQRWRNLGFAVAAFLGVASVWLTIFGVSVLRYIGISYGPQMMDHTENFRDPTSVGSLLYYPLAVRDALSVPGLVLVLAAVVVGLLGRETRGRVALCAAAAIGGIGALSSVPEAVDRYAVPGVMALCALLPALAPRGGARWRQALLVPAVLVFGPQAWATVQAFRPGAPVGPANYDYTVGDLWDLAWPLPRGFLPTNRDLSAWRLDQVAAAIQQAQGSRDGTIGVLAPDAMREFPSFGNLLIATSARGCRYDFANLRGSRQPPVFVGPLFDGQWPPSTFHTLVAVFPERADLAITQWLSTHTAQPGAMVKGPGTAKVVIYQVEPGSQ